MAPINIRCLTLTMKQQLNISKLMPLLRRLVMLIVKYAGTIPILSQLIYVDKIVIIIENFKKL